MEESSRKMLMKVPQITLVFWAAKLLSTAFGESFSDFVFFNDFIGEHHAMLIGAALLGIMLVLQFRTKRYTPWIYWLTVAAVSIFGTMSADFLNKDLGMPLYASTLMFLGIQAAIFIAWYKVEGTLDVHSINTGRKEAFYWLTVLCTFALGTAAGDFTSDTLQLGTLVSTFIFLIAITLPFIGVKWLKLNAIFGFWFAYTMTRPLGASFSDWLGVPAPYGDGLQLGTDVMSLVFGVLMFVTIIFIDYRHRKTLRPHSDEITVG